MKKTELRALVREQVRKVLKEAFIGPFVFNTNTPDEELIAMYHEALDGFTNYKPGMHFKRTDYKMAYQAIEKILKQKGIAITEASLKEADMTRMYDGFKVLNDKTKKLTKFRYVKGRKNTDVENEAIAKLMKATGLQRANFGVHGFVRKGEYDKDTTPDFVNESVKLKEAKEYSFTFDYNTDPDDVEYIQNILMDSGADAIAEPGIDSEEMVVKAHNAVELRKAKKAIEADGFEINESVIKEASFRPTDKEDIESWLTATLETSSTSKIKRMTKYITDEWKAVASNYASLQDYLDELEETGGLEESTIKEDAGMVVDVAMGVAVGLMGLWALVQSAPLVGRVFGAAAETIANKAEKKAKAALKNQRKETIAPIIAKFKNDAELKRMYQNLTPYSQGLNRKEVLDNKVRQKQLIAIGKYIKSKLTADEMQYFKDVSAMLRDGDIKESVIKEEITLNSPSFKNLVKKVQEISDKSGNDWDALKSYLKGRYAFFDTYTTGTNPAAYVVNFFSITKGQDKYVKKNPKNYVQIGEWYIRPW